MALPNHGQVDLDNAAPSPAILTHHACYSSAHTDLFNGQYADITTEYASLLANTLSPASIYARVIASTQDLPHTYVMLAGSVAQRLGFLATQWASRAFGSVGEVLGSTTGTGLINRRIPP
jgi:hypothetical protein